MSTQLSASNLHIPAEEADPKDDMVEKDSSGNYVMAAPSTSLNKREMDGVINADEERGMSTLSNGVACYKNMG
jgi:hypothetical protein